MSVLRVPRQHGVVRAARQFIESCQSFGEECIILSMYHDVDMEHDGAQKCPVCYDDVYEQTDTSNCTNCWGTGIDGGVKKIARAWAIFTDNETDEMLTKRGEFEPDMRNVQVEAYPTMNDHDYVIRVRQWSEDHKPLVLGPRYTNFNVQEVTLRVGNRFGQMGKDKIAQKTVVRMLPSSDLMQQFPVDPTKPILRDSSSPFLALG